MKTAVFILEINFVLSRVCLAQNTKAKVTTLMFNVLYFIWVFLPPDQIQSVPLDKCHQHICDLKMSEKTNHRFTQICPRSLSAPEAYQTGAFLVVTSKKGLSSFECISLSNRINVQGWPEDSLRNFTAALTKHANVHTEKNRCYSFYVSNFCL